MPGIPGGRESSVYLRARRGFHLYLCNSRISDVGRFSFYKFIVFAIHMLPPSKKIIISAFKICPTNGVCLGCSKSYSLRLIKNIVLENLRHITHSKK